MTGKPRIFKLRLCGFSFLILIGSMNTATRLLGSTLVLLCFVLHARATTGDAAIEVHSETSSMIIAGCADADVVVGGQSLGKLVATVAALQASASTANEQLKVSHAAARVFFPWCFFHVSCCFAGTV